AFSGGSYGLFGGGSSGLFRGGSSCNSSGGLFGGNSSVVSCSTKYRNDGFFLCEKANRVPEIKTDYVTCESSALVILIWGIYIDYRSFRFDWIESCDYNMVTSTSTYF
ncbi:20954_t:CDS:2, partial [Racocetra persica]